MRPVKVFTRLDDGKLKTVAGLSQRIDGFVLLIQLLDLFRRIMLASHGSRTVILESGDFTAVCEEHQAVVTAMRAHEPDRAQAAMRHHMAMIQRRIDRMYGDARMHARARAPVQVSADPVGQHHAVRTRTFRPARAR